MNILIENISRGVDESFNPLLTRTIGHCTKSGEKFDDEIFNFHAFPKE